MVTGRELEEVNMKRTLFTAFLALTFLFLPGVPTASAILGIGEEELSEEEKQAEIKEERAEIQTMVRDTLARLYGVQPSAKQAVQNAAGYAVFSNFGMKIMFEG